MANILIPPKWRRAARRATPEDVFFDRRAFMKSAGAAALTIAGGGAWAARAENDGAETTQSPSASPAPGLYPPTRNPQFKIERPLTEADVAGSHNNFYEFANAESHGAVFQKAVHREVEGYAFRPWEVEIGGLCESPRTMTIDEIEKLAPLEERLYRFRCVETWAMTVPWIGYPLAKLIEAARPKPEANYVRFVTFLDKKLPGVSRAPFYPWPYYEALHMDEAMNELTLLCTGVYGKPLPGQHGAPVRVIVPWKYGYKSPKSIAKIEFVAGRPTTFWNDLQPEEYGFLSNVEPNVPHPRWSQKYEWMIPDRGDRYPTEIYNGYADYAADLY